MFKRRTILAGLTVLGLTLAVSTQVYGQSTSGPEAWENVYNEAVAGATTTITASILNIVFNLLTFLNLAGFWGG
ncbi:MULTISPECIES: hypothetical protein [Chlorogloeopsis]|jgi:hypothetical protein|uniref:Uncharacterized protein n=1 Tax=Chlorogloeopsis fritschii PCC 6912 TaxID=211165 RepID=A0A3S1ACE9_CHLFR|nr:MULTISPECIES: hypothetical protein [Chlorogloeopsis]MDM9380293.1 hypothetical protein [Chlorogloeopsis sp. ULAP01]RUR75716.1 hypothetical protein PCC6912_46130 [Chlorogloeopsis fritschii PCC 6912]